jgi:hypothetical protein
MFSGVKFSCASVVRSRSFLPSFLPSTRSTHTTAPSLHPFIPHTALSISPHIPSPFPSFPTHPPTQFQTSFQKPSMSLQFPAIPPSNKTALSSDMV